MSRVYLIRHAKPSATWGGDDGDPGLDVTGQSQARRAADELMSLRPDRRPTRVVSSPLRRCQETQLSAPTTRSSWTQSTSSIGRPT